MSHSQFHCTGRAYLDMHGLIFETSICYWQDQPGRSACERSLTARGRGGRGGGGGGRERRGGGRERGRRGEGKGRAEDRKGGAGTGPPRRTDPDATLPDQPSHDTTHLSRSLFSLPLTHVFPTHPTTTTTTNPHPQRGRRRESRRKTNRAAQSTGLERGEGRRPAAGVRGSDDFP